VVPFDSCHWLIIFYKVHAVQEKLTKNIVL
jgi:hypothetical protein